MKYIILDSKDHLKKGEEAGFAQAGYGKKSQFQKWRKMFEYQVYSNGGF